MDHEKRAHQQENPFQPFYLADAIIGCQKDIERQYDNVKNTEKDAYKAE